MPQTEEDVTDIKNEKQPCENAADAAADAEEPQKADELENDAVDEPVDGVNEHQSEEEDAAELVDTNTESDTDTDDANVRASADESAAADAEDFSVDEKDDDEVAENDGIIADAPADEAPPLMGTPMTRLPQTAPIMQMTKPPRARDGRRSALQKRRLHRCRHGRSR